MLPALSAVAGDTKDFLARNAKLQWGLMLTVFAISHAPAVLPLDLSGYGCRTRCCRRRPRQRWTVGGPDRRRTFRHHPFSPLQAAAMSAVIVIGGFFGGFVLSAIQRDLSVKDWGRMIEGHGGILDRMDSVSFASPLFFHLTRYYFAT